MTTSQYISVREAAQILGISEKKIMDLVQGKKLQAYKIADQFLRLKKEEVLGLRNTGTIANENIQYPYTQSDRLRDFFYYNDFYMISAAVIIFLVIIVLRG
jgi:excisionase family DNA binding protein